jgi:hypothetical protein
MRLDPNQELFLLATIRAAFTYFLVMFTLLALSQTIR